MRIYKTFSKSKILSMWLITGAVLATLLIFPTECRAGAASGVFLCIQVLIPSLFPFMVLSGFIVSSGLSSRVPKCIGKTVGAVFGLPDDTAAIILLSLVGGYPVGAKGISSLYKDRLISEKQAERMSMFCVASGPGFLVTYLGTGMMRNTAIGYILLTSQTLSVIILGIIARFAVRCPLYDDVREQRHRDISAGSALITALSEGIKACSGMCALVVLFGAFCEIFLSLTENTPSMRWLTAIIEITNGTKILAERYPTVLMSAACGFGGLCVHFQVLVQLGNIKISKVKFYIFRVLQAILCATFTYILLRIFPQTESVFSTVSDASPQLHTGIIGCIFLILSCIAFLISVRNKNRYQ